MFEWIIYTQRCFLIIIYTLKEAKIKSSKKKKMEEILEKKVDVKDVEISVGVPSIHQKKK